MKLEVPQKNPANLPGFLFSVFSATPQDRILRKEDVPETPIYFSYRKKNTLWGLPLPNSPLVPATPF